MSGAFTKSKYIFSMKHKCQFCLAYFKDGVTYAEHSESCSSRLSAFLASDGRIKFACAVCRDVFDDPTELTQHEQLHKFPGGFACVICNETFLSESDCIRHTEDIHKAFKCIRCENEPHISIETSYIEHCEREHDGASGYAICLECGVSFEEKSHLRFHSETECGKFRSWTCFECAAIFASENALSEHMGSHLPNGFQHELECDANQHDVEAVAFASFECIKNVYESKVEELSIDDYCSGSEFSGQIDLDRSHYSDDYHASAEISTVVKEVADDSIVGQTIGQQQDERLHGDSESEHENENKASDTREQDKRAKASEHRKICKWCGLKFVQQSALNKHMKDKHSQEVKRNENGDNENECKFCSRCFSAPQYLEKHYRDLHGKYECDRCGHRTGRKRRLVKHINTKCARKSRTCQVCDEYFVDVRTMLAHREQHPASELLCRKCGKSYSTFSQLQNHWFAHNRKDRRKTFEHACRLCDEKYASKTRLLNHIVLHGADGKLIVKCECCPKFFATVEDKDEHKKVIHLNDITCPHCKKICTNQGILRAHIKYLHMEATHHICTKCGKSFSNLKQLELHEKSNCGRDPIYKCDQCGKSLSNEYTYRAHLQIHQDNNSRPFICNQCGKASRTKSGLKKHERIHIGEKRLKCDYCDKGFNDRTSKMQHESTHTGIKPYMCQCGDRFSYISNLQAHRRARKTTCGLLPLISKAFPQINPDHISLPSMDVE